LLAAVFCIVEVIVMPVTGFAKDRMARTDSRTGIERRTEAAPGAITRR
jgi:hypothetical protein